LNIFEEEINQYSTGVVNHVRTQKSQTTRKT